MSDWSDQVKAAFLESRATFGVDFTVNAGATTYRGVMLSGPEILALGLGGFTQDWNRGLQFLGAEVTITNGDKITIGSNTYRALRPDTSDEDPVQMVALEGVNK